MGVAERTTFTLVLGDGATTVGGTAHVDALATNLAPTAIGLERLRVLESATEIGRLSATDPNGDVLTFTLVDNPGDLFAIADGKLVLATGKALDFEQATSHTVTVRVSDGTLSTDKSFTIEVGDVAMSGIGLSVNRVTENAAAGTVVGTLALTGDATPGANWSYELLADAGMFVLNGDRIEVKAGARLDFETARSQVVVVRATDGTNVVERAVTIEVDDVVIEDVRGTEGRNTLEGASGRDRLYGGLGNDVLTGKEGADIFVFDTALGRGQRANVDRITDFTVGTDVIWLDNAIFTRLGAGDAENPVQLAAGAFVTGSRARQADDRIIYNKRTGDLFYDADGSGRGAAVKFATLEKNLALTADHFFIV